MMIWHWEPLMPMKNAYEKLNLTESAFPVFFGIDGTDVGLKAVRDSKLAGTVYNDKEKQAEAMAKLVFAVVAEKGMKDIPLENDKYIFVTYSKITTKNVDESKTVDKIAKKNLSSHNRYETAGFGDFA